MGNTAVPQRLAINSPRSSKILTTCCPHGGVEVPFGVTIIAGVGEIVAVKVGEGVMVIVQVGEGVGVRV